MKLVGLVLSFLFAVMAASFLAGYVDVDPGMVGLLKDAGLFVVGLAQDFLGWIGDQIRSQ